MKIIPILLLLLILKDSRQIDNNSKDTTKIPKILWTYWDSGFDGASLFTKLCINNMNFYAQKSGWQFRFLTKSNFTNYVSKQSQQRLKRMIATSKNYILLQNHVDIYRLFLLYQNGGMWLDTNSFFVNTLNWIQNIDKEITPYNRIRNDPDVITFTYNDLYGGNKTRVIDEKTGEQVYLFPGIQIWSFITKPYSKFMHDIIQSLEYCLATPRVELDSIHKQLGIVYGHQVETYFLPSNYQFQTVIQKKQKEIQKNPQKFDTKYAIDYYKIWSIDSLSTAFALFEINEWTVGTVMKSLFYDSIESFSEKYHTKIYFVKFTGDFYPFITIFLPHLQFLTCIQTINKIQPNSIISKYLFEPSSSMPIINGIVIQQHQLTKETECQLLQIQSIGYIALKIVFFLVIILALNYILFLMIKKGNQQSEINFIKIQSSDQ